MMLLMKESSDYGNLADLVTAAGCIMAAGGALALAWRGRANWEPAEQDVPKGAQKVAGLLTGVGILLMWFWLRSPTDAPLLTRIAIACGIACLTALLVYAFLISVFTYKQEYSPEANKTAIRTIVGGLWLRPQSRQNAKSGITQQAMLKGAGNEPDEVWSRPSRAVVKLAFILGYIVLTCCGTAALAAVSILYGLRS